MKKQPIKFVLFVLAFFAVIKNAKADFTIQGRLLESDNATPVTASGVQFRLQVRTAGPENCLLYEETQTVDLSQSRGMFALTLGQGTRSSNTIDGGLPLTTVLSNTQSMTTVASSCSVSTSTYIPTATAIRHLSVSFNDGNGWDNIPTIPLNPVPQSTYSFDAANLGGYNSSMYVLNSQIPQCTAAEFLTKTSSGFVCQALNFGTGAGQIPQLDGSGHLSTSVLPTTVTTAITTISSATSLNVANTLVQRDSSGSVSMTTVQAITVNTSTLQAANASLNNIYLYNAGNSNYVRINSPTSLINYTLTLPDSLGASGTVLSVDGSGQFYWRSAATAVTSSTIEAAFGTVAANKIFASPDGSSGSPSFRILQISDLRSSVSGQFLTGGSCSTGQVLVYSSVTDTMYCSALTIAGDVTGTVSNTTVAKIKSVAVNVTNLTNNDVLQYNGTGYVNRNIPTCAANQYLTFDGTIYSCATDVGSTNSGVTAGSYGSATQIPTLTVDAYGRLTSVTNTTVTPTWSSITSTPTTLAGYGITDAVSSGAIIAITNGGTGATTQAGAANSVLPSQTGHSGKYLTTDGSNVSWGNLTSSQWATSGTTINYTAGRVGIGTTAPSSPLHIVSNDSTITLQATGSGSYSGMNIFDSNNYLAASFQYGNSSAGVLPNTMFIGTRIANAPLVFISGGGVTGGSLNERVRIDSTGYVGIGTSSPSRVFHVSHSSAPTVLIENTGSPVNSKRKFMSASSGNLILGRFSDDMSSSSQQLIIDNTGRVGIGITSPSNALDVSGTVNVTGGFKINGVDINNTTGTPAWSNVTGTPTTLSGYGITDAVSSGAIIAITNGGTGATTQAGARSNLGLGTAATRDVGLASGNIPQLGFSGIVANKMCTSDGSSGLICNTTIPTSSQWSTSGTTINYTSGNVGIGTNSPSTALDVTGSVKASGDIVPGGYGVLRGIVELPMSGQEVIVNSNSQWQTITRKSYTSFQNHFSAFPVLGGATRKYYIIIRKADNLEAEGGSEWRFVSVPWGPIVPGHGFTVDRDWGNLAEGSQQVVELPSDPVTNGSGSGADLYWRIDAKLPSAAPADRKLVVMKIQIAAVDVVGGTNPAFSAAVGGTVDNAIPTMFWGALSANLWTGNVGVGLGTATVDYPLTVSGVISARTSPTTKAALVLQDQNGSAQFKISSDANVTSDLTLPSLRAAGGVMMFNAGSGGTIHFGNDTATNVNFNFGHLSVDSSLARVGIGYNPGDTGDPIPSKLSVRGSGTVAFFTNGTESCSVTPASGGNVSCTSDERLKKNIISVSIEKALQDILKLESVTYEWKSNHGLRQMGYLAQKVEIIAPDLVTTNSDGYKQVSYVGLVPRITAAIKQLANLYSSVIGKIEKQERAIASLQKNRIDQETVDQLKDENYKLKKENTEIKARLDKIEKTLRSK